MRTLSPTRITFTGSGASSYSSAAASSSKNFVVDRSASQVRSSRRPISPKGGAPLKSFPCAPPRKTCMCSRTNHPGSFRCSLHRNRNNSSSSTMKSQLNAKRFSTRNSLVRIDGVEGEWVRRALTPLIHPSNHHMRRRTSFQPRPSRLCHMTAVQDIS